MTHQERIDAYYKARGEETVKVKKAPTFTIQKSQTILIPDRHQYHIIRRWQSPCLI